MTNIQEQKAGTAAPVKQSGTQPAMRLVGISKTYPGSTVPAVNKLSLDVYDGEVITLLGPSGCGKSTTLRMVAGLEVPDEGDIYFGDKAVVISDKNLRLPPDKRELGMVFQSYAIWPHMTVEENISFPLKARHFKGSEIKDRVANVLDLVGMPGMQKRPGPLLRGVGSFSGGVGLLLGRLVPLGTGRALR